MPFSTLLEAESYIANLSEETKQKLVSTISFMLINNINQQNSIDMFSLIQKMASLIPNDSQKPFLSEINSVVVKYLFKNNIDVFPIIHKLSDVLNEDSKQKIITDISFVIENTITNNKLSVSVTQPGKYNADLPAIQPLIAKNTEPAPAPFGANTLGRQIQNQPKNNTPPPPPATTPSNVVSKPMMPKPALITGSFNIKPKDTSKDNENNVMSVKESFRYIIPIQTQLAQKALTDFTTPTDVYQYLKAVNGQSTLDKIYLDLYSSFDVMTFIYKTYSMFNAKNIVFKKTIDIPVNKEMRLKIGQWLVMLGYLQDDKLDRVVQLHNVALKNNDVNNRRFAAKTMVNGMPVETKTLHFGDFLLESEVITKEQLNQALTVQKQYNEILSSLK